MTGGNYGTGTSNISEYINLQISAEPDEGVKTHEVTLPIVGERSIVLQKASSLLSVRVPVMYFIFTYHLFI
jgi:hypothetical protein